MFSSLENKTTSQLRPFYNIPVCGLNYGVHKESFLWRCMQPQLCIPCWSYARRRALSLKNEKNDWVYNNHRWSNGQSASRSWWPNGLKAKWHYMLIALGRISYMQLVVYRVHFAWSDGPSKAPPRRQWVWRVLQCPCPLCPGRMLLRTRGLGRNMIHVGMETPPWHTRLFYSVFFDDAKKATLCSPAENICKYDVQLEAIQRQIKTVGG